MVPAGGFVDVRDLLQQNISSPPGVRIGMSPIVGDAGAGIPSSDDDHIEDARCLHRLDRQRHPDRPFAISSRTSTAFSPHRCKSVLGGASH